MQRVVTHCYKFANGMVMAFDQYGKQMPDYQGPLSEIEPKIRSVYAGPIEELSWEDVRQAMAAASFSDFVMRVHGDALIEQCAQIAEHIAPGKPEDEFERGIDWATEQIAAAIRTCQRTRPMRMCEQCGLPIPACNALAMYRRAAMHLERGEIGLAKDSIESAREFEADFNERQQAKRK